MSDHETHSEAAPASPFDKNDIRGFEADDAEAGGAIGKLLSILFIYTLLAMSIVVLWTVSVSSN